MDAPPKSLYGLMVCGLLFVAAFTTTLLHYGAHQPAHQAVQPAREVPAGYVPAGNPRETASATTSLPPAAQEEAVASESVPPQAIADLQQQLVSEERETRGIAVRRLARVPGDAAVQALLQVLHEDPAARNRILAIESLRKSSDSFGDRDQRIREALRTASVDNDEVIAQMARDAYFQLIKKAPL